MASIRVCRTAPHYKISFRFAFNTLISATTRALETIIATLITRASIGVVFLRAVSTSIIIFTIKTTKGAGGISQVEDAEYD